MNGYQRLFGSGPRGAAISLGLLALAWWLEPVAGLPSILDDEPLRWALFGLSAAAALALTGWGLLSLPPGARGRRLVTGGAFRYVRHPLYAAFLSSLNFGVALLLNDWIYLLWAVALHGVWHWNVAGEEALMRRAFPDEYARYCSVTGRFVPRLGAFRAARR